MNAVADKLREARALIERGFVKERYAFGKRRYVDPASKYALCFCSLGAISRVTGADTLHVPFTDEAKRLAAVIDGTSGDVFCDIIEWNDAPERTQAEVLAAFDRAIELAESEQ